ncbi:serine/threonine protein kinase [candidate division KSB1 bacterium]|nr:serine/threonine protein kinase [candidate division KSB1 bacterium]
MKTIGKYQLIAELHRGPITTVYKAFQPALNRIVLLKQLNPDLIADTELTRRFRDEGLMLASISHANVLSIFDAEVQDDVPFLVMEFIEGQTLAEHLEVHGPVPVDVAVDILSQLSAGLQALHRCGICHRDIKPDNILISPDGRVKLADLGFAGVAATQHIQGTPPYMTPETVQSGISDERSDLFSVGVVCYEMLTGENPFAADTIEAIFKRIINVEPLSVKNSRDDVPSTLLEIVERLLQKQPDQRLQSPGEILSELRLLLQQLERFDVKAYWDSPEQYQPIVFSENEVTPLGETPVVPQTRKSKVLYIVVGVVAVAIISAVWFMKQSSVGEKLVSMSEQTFEKPLVPVDSNKAPSADENIVSINTAKLNQQTQVAEKKPEIVARVTDKPGTAKTILAIDTSRLVALDSTVINKIEVEIETDPRAWVLMNGDTLGIAPVSINLNKDVAEITVSLLCPGFPTIEKTLHTRALVENMWFVSLWQEVGYLQVDVQPWGEIWIDGDSLDVTPVSQPIRLAQGSHSLTIRHPHLPARMETIHITAGDTLQRHYSLLR